MPAPESQKCWQPTVATIRGHNTIHQVLETQVKVTTMQLHLLLLLLPRAALALFPIRREHW